MIDKKTILSVTHGGLDVFKRYFGADCEKKLFRNPYREDRKASCHLYLHEGHDGLSRFILHDFGDRSWCGDCFAVAAKVHGMERSPFSDVIDMINRDLSLNCQEPFVSSRVPMSEVADWKRKEKSRAIETFTANYRSFTCSELKYWAQYGIFMETLSKYHVSSVVDICFKRKDGSSFYLFSTKLTPCFTYGFAEGRGIKVYRPKSDVRFMYAGELPRPYVFGIEQLPDHGDTVYVTGGEKDVMSLSAHGFSAISFNSETADIPRAILDVLASRFNKIVLLYDMDETGVRESRRMLWRYGDDYALYRMALPLSGTKSEKDISDWFRLGHKAEELSTYNIERK